MKKLWPIPLFLLGMISICALWTTAPKLVEGVRHNIPTTQASDGALSPVAKALLLTAAGIIAIAVLAVLAILVAKAARKYSGKVKVGSGVNVCIGWIKTGWGVIIIALTIAFALSWASSVPGWEWVKDISKAMWYVVAAVVLATIGWPRKGWTTEKWQKFSIVAMLLIVLGGTAWRNQVEIREKMSEWWPKSAPATPERRQLVTTNTNDTQNVLMVPTGRYVPVTLDLLAHCVVTAEGLVRFRTKSGKEWLDGPGHEYDSPVSLESPDDRALFVTSEAGRPVRLIIDCETKVRRK